MAHAIFSIFGCANISFGFTLPFLIFFPLFVNHFGFFLFVESPLQFYVNYPNTGSVSAFGPGLIYGVANKPATFTIVTEDAGEGIYFFNQRCISP